MTTLLEVDRLSVAVAATRGSTNVLEGVSIDVGPGEIVAVMGESGAGKSMLGAAILGLLPPEARITGGAIRLDGKRIDDVGEAALQRLRGSHVAAIFQDTEAALHPMRTVGSQLAETIAFHAGLSRTASAARAEWWLEAVGLGAGGERARAYPHMLSGGMRQRAVIALALCSEPRLVIADEPTSALDGPLRRHMMALFRRLAATRGTGFLLITHDRVVTAQADRLAVLSAGQVVEAGCAATILASPQHPCTASLLTGERLHDIG